MLVEFLSGFRSLLKGLSAKPSASPKRRRG